MRMLGLSAPPGLGRCAGVAEAKGGCGVGFRMRISVFIDMGHDGGGAGR
jgi:hypothetical protein